MGYIYLINEWGTDNYKIGVTNSKNIDERRLKLQTGNSNELFICKKFNTINPFKLEKLLHLFFSQKNILNEWFILSDDEVSNFLNICENFNNTLKLLDSENEFY